MTCRTIVCVCRIESTSTQRSQGCLRRPKCRAENLPSFIIAENSIVFAGFRDDTAEIKAVCILSFDAFNDVYQRIVAAGKKTRKNACVGPEWTQRSMLGIAFGIFSERNENPVSPVRIIFSHAL